MTLLLAAVDEQAYWRSWHGQPLEHWRPVLDLVSERHGLRNTGWERSAHGKNIVLMSQDVVLKLSPPFWVEDLRGEESALRVVAGRLPVATPEIIATGEIEGWRYLLVPRLPGVSLRSIWRGLTADQRADIVRQQGELAAAIHTLPIDDTPSRLDFDWSAMLHEQRKACVSELRRGGVPEPLVEDAGSYLDAAVPLLVADTSSVLLHGDLSAGNVLMEHDAGTGWRISGLIDWGDSRLGPPSHDLLSPNINTFKGERDVVLAWHADYRTSRLGEPARIQHLLMARALLYYAEDFGVLLSHLPGVRSGRSLTRWSDIASHLWHLTGLTSPPD